MSMTTPLWEYSGNGADFQLWELGLAGMAPPFLHVTERDLSAHAWPQENRQQQLNAFCRVMKSGNEHFIHKLGYLRFRRLARNVPDKGIRRYLACELDLWVWIVADVFKSSYASRVWA